MLIFHLWIIPYDSQTLVTQHAGAPLALILLLHHVYFLMTTVYMLITDNMQIFQEEVEMRVQKNEFLMTFSIP
jgi:hypothetical protein